MFFYIFGGSYASKIPFYVNSLTKFRKKENFVSTGRSASPHACNGRKEKVKKKTDDHTICPGFVYGLWAGSDEDI